LDIFCLGLQHTYDLFQFFPQSILRIFDNDIVPVLEIMYKSSVKQNPLEYQIGVRLIKLSVLIINNLGIGINLLGYILQETDNLVVRAKDGTQVFNLSWRTLLAFEGIAIILGNPNLIQIFSTSGL
jgi:hypothetical protein